MTILTSTIPWPPSSVTSVIAKLLTRGPKFPVAPRTRFGFSISAATGAFAHDNCGDIFSPPLQLAVLFGIIPPSLKVVDVSTKPVRRNGAVAPLATEFILDLKPPEITDELRAYAAPSFEPGRPLIEMLRDLTSRIYSDFTYRSGSTTVSTQVSEVLAAREGVCQDFARLAIACLRANGLAASYVSGYLATDPPPGKERMIGIDATHAWASVWTPQNHWLGLDPTNDQMVDERYITVGLGRDYADVPPLRGIIYTDSESSVIDVAVDVAPFESAYG